MNNLFNPSISGGGGTIQSGTYTGNDSFSRQITVGFRCRMVLLQTPSGLDAGLFGLYCVGISATTCIGSSVTEKTDAGLLCHASDGFIVGCTAGQYFGNIAAQVYQWVAFGY